MKRREFIAGFGAIAAWPAVVHAQQKGRIPTVGVLMAGQANDGVVKTFESAFPELKLIEGRNVHVDYRCEMERLDSPEP